MKPFKFFQKETGTLDAIEGETYATASFNDDTPEAHIRRRYLFHNNPEEYNRQRRLHYERRGHSVMRGDSIGTQHQDETDSVPFFFGTTRVTEVKPKFWTKVKMKWQTFKIHFIGLDDSIIWLCVILGPIVLTLMYGFIKTYLLNIW